MLHRMLFSSVNVASDAFPSMFRQCYMTRFSVSVTSMLHRTLFRQCYINITSHASRQCYINVTSHAFPSMLLQCYLARLPSMLHQCYIARFSVNVTSHVLLFRQRFIGIARLSVACSLPKTTPQSWCFSLLLLSLFCLFVCFGIYVRCENILTVDLLFIFEFFFYSVH